MGRDLPVLTPPETADGPTGSRVAGVLLAAGTSSRFGAANKLLAPLDGDPLVVHAARTLVAAGCDPLVAVVGHEAERVAAALADLPFDVVENPAYAEGQSTSVRTGVRALPDDVAAAVFALGDMPFVAPATARALVATYRAGDATALAAACDGERGNPVLFDRTHFATLADVSGDTGGRRILLCDEGAALVETGDPGVRRDIDTRADLEE